MKIISYDYCIYRKDRNTCGGGILIEVHNSIPSRIIESPSDLELIAIDLHNFNCTLRVVYVPPAIILQDFTNILSFLEELTSSGSVLIMGDFNRPDFNWS